jgi:hypothetical protein
MNKAMLMFACSAWWLWLKKVQWSDLWLGSGRLVYVLSKRQIMCVLGVYSKYRCTMGTQPVHNATCHHMSPNVSPLNVSSGWCMCLHALLSCPDEAVEATWHGR